MWIWLVSVGSAQEVPPVVPPDVPVEVPVDEPIPPPAADPFDIPIVPTEGPAVLELTGEGRLSYDVTVFIRYDGNLYYQDELILASDLEPILTEWVTANPDTRIVISADTLAPYEAIVKVTDLAHQAGATRTALEITGMETPHEPGVDPLFPGAGLVEELDGEPTNVEVLRPKRHRFPQNPYANTSSFTAYTLEWGETKVGLGSILTGVVPRVQLGTAPLLDAVGVWNINAKANLTRVGPFDAAFVAQYYNVPLTGLVGGALNGSGGTTTASASYLGIGATGSLQILDPWSIHGQLYWARPSARGNISFDDLPEVLLPGLSLGDTGAIGLGVTGDLAVLNLATDLRFNRRDSVFAWLRAPIYGRVRGMTNGRIDGFDELENADFIIAYGDWIKFSESYSVAIGYQASWKHLDARVGVGMSAIPGAWILQAFELSYRFGGTTRRNERKIRKGYREVRGNDDELPTL